MNCCFVFVLHFVLCYNRAIIILLYYYIIIFVSCSMHDLSLISIHNYAVYICIMQHVTQFLIKSTMILMLYAQISLGLCS